MTATTGAERQRKYMKRLRMKEAHIGDGVYASFDGWSLNLRDPKPRETIISLSKSAFEGLVDFVNKIDRDDIAETHIGDGIYVSFGGQRITLFDPKPRRKTIQLSQGAFEGLLAYAAKTTGIKYRRVA
jgi:hypothetical protein